MGLTSWPHTRPNGYRQRALLDALNNGIVIVDGGGVIVALNHAAARILRLPPARVLGHRLADLPLPQMLAQVFQDLGVPRPSLARATEIEATLPGAKGRVRYFRIRISAIADTWLVEWMEFSEAVALRRAASSSAGAENELQQAHEELQCALEIAETEMDIRCQKLRERDAVIEQLLQENRLLRAGAAR